MKLIPGRALLPLALAAALACSSEDQAPPRTLSRVVVTPPTPWLLVGSTMQFSATAVYSDGDDEDVTERATWASSSAALSVSEATGTRGEAQGSASGSSTVTASWGGLSGSASATVVAAGDGVTLVGTVTYDFVPATYDPAIGTGGLELESPVVKPVRGAVVRVMQGTSVLAQTTTDAGGHYIVTFAGAPGAVSVVALAKTLSPAMQIEDNADGDAVWAIGKSVAPVSGTHDLHATHGWTGTAYDPALRSAAPFAILDSMLTAAQGFVAAGRSPLLPALEVNWSPDNVGSSPDTYDPSQGLIVTSHYAPWEGEIYILGKAGDDTDEFDSHVVVHEWGHFFEDKLSRSDSPGGAHGTGDVLDPRLAFGEGYGSALAAMLLPESIYADTFWLAGGSVAAFGFDAETAPSPTDDYGPLNPGPFSELSIVRLLYDLWDPANEAWDDVSLGLGPIYDVLVGPQRTTPALTTVASFVAGLKAQPGVDAVAVDALLAHYSIGPITDALGTGDPDLRAMYRDVLVPSQTTVTLDGRYESNAQQQNRYLVFTATGNRTRVTSESTRDVDLYAYESGALRDFDDSLDGDETLEFATTPGRVYVVVVTGWGAVNGTYAASVSLSTY
jgi:hypothetical protein